MNRGLPELDLPGGRDSWCSPKRARPLEAKMTFEGVCIFPEIGHGEQP